MSDEFMEMVSLMATDVRDAALVLSLRQIGTLQAENARLRATLSRAREHHVEGCGCWLCVALSAKPLITMWQVDAPSLPSEPQPDTQKTELEGGTQ